MTEAGVANTQNPAMSGVSCSKCIGSGLLYPPDHLRQFRFLIGGLVAMNQPLGCQAIQKLDRCSQSGFRLFFFLRIPDVFHESPYS